MNAASLASSVIPLGPPRAAAVAERQVPRWGPTGLAITRVLCLWAGLLAAPTASWAMGRAPAMLGPALLGAHLIAAFWLWRTLRLRAVVRRGRLATCAITDTLYDADVRAGGVVGVTVRYALELDGRRYRGRCQLRGADLRGMPRLPDNYDRALVLFDPHQPRLNLVWGFHFLNGRIYLPR